MFGEDGQMEQKPFLAAYKGIDNADEVSDVIKRVQTAADVQMRFAKHNVFFIAKRTIAGKGDVVYFSATLKKTAVLIEVTVGSDACKVCVRSPISALAKAGLHGIKALLKL